MKYSNKCFVFLLPFLLSCSSVDYTVIQNVDLFDGKQVHQHVNLVFTDSLITSINQKRRFKKHARVIDGQGKTILPPLLNAHVHVREPDNLKEAQSVGIFALLDMFSTNRRATYLRSFQDSTAYALFYSSNAGATVPGGHGTQFRVPIPTISEQLSPEQFVQERIAEGADYIKLTQEHSMAKLDLHQVLALVQAAHRRNCKVVGHVSSLTDGLDIARQGVDGLAHIWYRSGSIADAPSLETLKNRGTFIIPTLSVIKRLVEQASEGGHADSFLAFEQVLKEVKKAKEVGLKILAGTDAPNFGMNYHDQLFEELYLLTKAGLTELEALQAGTSNIYEAFELDAFSGLQVGKPASFLLIDGHPHQQIEDLWNSKRIWKNGGEIRGG